MQIKCQFPSTKLFGGQFNQFKPMKVVESFELMEEEWGSILGFESAEIDSRVCACGNRYKGLSFRRSILGFEPA